MNASTSPLNESAVAWQWPVDLTSYDRTSQLSDQEREAIAHMGSRSARERAAVLHRLIQPLSNVLTAVGCPQQEHYAPLLILLSDMHRRGTAYWGWSQNEWLETIGLTREAFEAAYRLADLEAQKQNVDKALEWLDRGEQWCREASSSHGLAWNMYLRGVLLIQRGDPAAAELFLTRSLNLTTWSGHHLIANDKYRLAQVYSETGQLQLALQMAEEARDLYERIGVTAKLASVEALLRKLSRKEADG